MIIGVDFSITCPCICVLRDTFKLSHFKFIADSSTPFDFMSDTWIRPSRHLLYKSAEERYDNISNTLIQFITDYSYHYEPNTKPTIYLEDYSLGSKGRVFNIAEATGLFKHKVHQKGWLLNTIPPTVIKKFATDKGNADKQMMYDAFLKQNNPDINKIFYPKRTKISSPISDIIDSYFIAKYGQYTQSHI